MRLSSLKARITLLSSVLAGLLWLLAVALTWFQARHEAGELFDAHLVQAASLLIAQTDGALKEEDDDTREDHHAPQLHHRGRRVAFQIWIDGHLRLHSAKAPDSPLSASREGFSDSFAGGERWRVFSAWNERHQALVQVGERMAAREELTSAVATGLLWPLLVALPVLALFIWLAVRQGVRPLDQVAGELERRSPGHLALLPTDKLPSEVLPLVQRLNALFGRVAQSFEQERRFTADAAHELRTPLAGLRAQVQVALEAQEDAARRHALDRLLQGCDRMTHLVEQLLSLARVDAMQPADFVPLDLTAVAREVIAQQVPLALAKEIDIELQADAEASMHGNPAWLAVLVRNLIDNAVRHTPRRGRIDIAIATDQGGIRLCVQDNGPGVSEEELASLGQRFWRSLEMEQEPDQDTCSGSGLGLSIVGRIAALHGGQVEYRNCVPTGLTIQVWLLRRLEISKCPAQEV